MKFRGNFGKFGQGHLRPVLADIPNFHGLEEVDDPGRDGFGHGHQLGGRRVLITVFRQSFQSYPTELIEAARIDGANEFTIFFRLVMAPMKSTFAAGAIYAFMKQWNNYLWPLIVIQTNEKKTFTLLLSSLASAYYVDYGQLMLAIVLATIPIIIVFLTMQKQFVEGIVGSSK